MSPSRKRVLMVQRGLGTGDCFRLQIVLQRCPSTSGSQHITHRYDRAHGPHECTTIEE
jgi:hypothetical protein